MSVWLLLAALGLVSLGLRSVLVLGANRFPLPTRVMRVCDLLGPAIIAAVLGGSVVAPLTAGAGVVELVPLAVGTTVAIRTRSTGATLAAGLATHGVLLLVV